MRPIELYVIGNGFDLWHGIPQSCSQFKEYVRHRDRSIFDAVGSYLSVGEDWGDLGDDTRGFVKACRDMKVTLHVARDAPAAARSMAARLGTATNLRRRGV